MPSVFLCHCEQDREAAEAIAARLERGAEARVELERCELVSEAWEGGTSSDAILLLLSPEAVPAKPARETWQGVLEHGGRPPLGTVLLRPCGYPRLLERRYFFRWTEPPVGTLRALERWALALHAPGREPSFTPARLPWFAGREMELELLWETLVDGAGTVAIASDGARDGKTSLAQEFARGAGGHFRDVLWIACGERSRTSLEGELASRLDISLEGSPEDVWARLVEVLRERRLLVVLDDVAGEPLIVAPPEGRASVLITRRGDDLPLPYHARVARIAAHGRKVIAEPPGDPASQRLWRAVAACRGGGFPLSLAARIAGLDQEEAGAAAARLESGRSIDPLEPFGRLFRVGAGKPDPPDEELRRRHAEALLAEFSGWRRQPERCLDLIAEAEAGMAWAWAADWELGRDVAQRCCGLLQERGRLPEAAQIYRGLMEAAADLGELDVVERCRWELSWLEDEEGRTRRRLEEGEQLAFDFG